MNFGIGLVSFKMNIHEIEALSESISNYQPLYKVVVDNSPTNILKSVFIRKGWEYIHDPENPGFGKSHNRIFHKFGPLAEFHLIVNPDITFDKYVIGDLISFLKNIEDAGCAIPKILYPSGKLQKSAKYLPSFFQLIFGRIWLIGNKIRSKTEFSADEYSKGIFRAPFLSGCFLLFKSKVLNEIRFFDERYFMYLEDMDLSRRLWSAEQYPYYYSRSHVFHTESRASSRSLRLFIKHFQSAFRYFLKWGFLDKKRELINRNARKWSLQLKN